MAFTCGTSAQPPTVPEQTLKQAFQGHPGAFVLIDGASGETFLSDPAACTEKLAPCSTFKIWNSAIGLETGLVEDPDALFWKWDGEKRSIEGWNQDQTLRSAMTVSCVPAYQALARKIGTERMQKWIDTLDYGDRDISAGLEVFWLPKPPDRKTILITAEEQAQLVAKLATWKLPFSAKTQSVLADIMKVKSTDRGTLYGKTGTGAEGRGDNSIGWFVGYVESGGKTFAFACLLKGEGVMGKDARGATETILGSLELL
ncbi:MAG: class D beta-lactamase [Chthoniobacterales bacterium]|nr:class D beta-lactamase [Chthoniobacterales bacterium]